MGEKSVTLQLPDDLYESVQEAAEASPRTMFPVSTLARTTRSTRLMVLHVHSILNH